MTYTLADNFSFEKEEIRVLKSLKTPAKVQDFLDELKYNLELKGETCYSPKIVLRLKMANCMEGAIFAAAALRVNGHRPLLVDLLANIRDDDHVIAVYKIKGYWGSIGKSKFTGLRFREPIYPNLRTLVLSYFEDYFNEEGEKTLIGYATRPVDLSIFDKKNWMTSSKHVWFIPDYFEKIKHTKILPPFHVRHLRRVPEKELKAGMFDYPKNYNRKH